MKEILVNVIMLSEGDPSALECLVGMLASFERREMALKILPKLYACDITGADLGELFRELAGCDYERMLRICENIKPDILISLCKRRDGGGRELVERYLLLSGIHQN